MTRQPLHTRGYGVEAFKIAEDTMVLRGEVRDTKPAGMYIEGDTEPLDIHHMIVELTLSYPQLVITAAEVVFETHPHTLCPAIATHYESLVGLSIARGFTHKVRELFGGPRGCTHTTALLQAMAPVAVQSAWSMRALSNATRPEIDRELTDEQREAIYAGNMNTCHVWDEHGEQVTLLRRGEEMEVPLWIERRLDELGRSPDEWFRRRG
jgi:hypothetical protein